MISVIVTTYNRKDQLKLTIDSILNQTYKDFELIVVDNYSNYDFFSFIDSFSDTRIRAYQNANNGIISINRNFGILKANGEYLAFCDDDDYWYNTKLEVSISMIKGYDISYHKLQTTQGFPLQTKDVSLDPLSVLCKGNCIAYSSVMMKRTLALNVNMMDETPSIVAVEDWDFWLRSAYAGAKFVFINEVLGVYYLGQANTSRSLKQIDRMNAIINKYKDSLTDRQAKTMQGYVTYLTARAYHSFGEYKRSLRYYLPGIINIYDPIIMCRSFFGVLLAILRVYK